ncbi:MAG: U32 family peptidase [Candidatus Omnitrophica bacterium]|nr:U32 family peptidase [Candidatus Omnitrophota bacterium]
MKFSVPTNWQDDLLPIFDSPKIDEVYGKLAEDYIGGGRPGYSLFRVSKKKIARYIERVHKSNCKFNYLLNASCLGGREFTRKGYKKIIKLIDWLLTIGVDSVTVSLPYLAEIIKRDFPSLKINVSVMAHVDSIEKAKFWESAGVGSITLLHTRVNRDFELLKQIRKNVKCKLQLMANNHCLYNCPFEEYHELFSSHASQSGHFNGNFIFDYCYLTCRYKKTSNPALLISSPWIRPEDVAFYEQVGIDSIKLVDRRLPATELVKIINAYIEEKYEGNLIDLFPNLCAASPLGTNNILLRIKHLFNSISTNLFVVSQLKHLLEKIEIFIDNQALNGFIDFFLTHNCQLVSCEDCGYCRDIAAKVVKIDKGYQSRICEEYKKLLNVFLSG